MIQLGLNSRASEDSVQIGIYLAFYQHGKWCDSKIWSELALKLKQTQEFNKMLLILGYFSVR